RLREQGLPEGRSALGFHSALDRSVPAAPSGATAKSPSTGSCEAPCGGAYRSASAERYRDAWSWFPPWEMERMISTDSVATPQGGCRKGLAHLGTIDYYLTVDL